MAEIKFEYHAWEPFCDVEVIAEEDGTQIQVFILDDDQEVKLEDMAASDQSRIKALVKDWANHYEYMGKLDEPHPAQLPYSKDYIEWLNRKTNEPR